MTGKVYLCPLCNGYVRAGDPDCAVDRYRGHCHASCLAKARK